MKKVMFVLLIFFSLFFVSCNYGWSELFYRDDQVNIRSTSITEYDGTEVAPDLKGKEKYSVIIITDLHIGKLKEEALDRFNSWLNEKSRLLKEQGFEVAFIICMGDMTDSGFPSEYRKYSYFCQSINENFGLKVYNVVGNHDLYNSGWQYYKTYCYPYNSAYHFTTDTDGVKLSWYFLDSANGTLGTSQLGDLKKKFAADSNYKIVITHYPLYAAGAWYYVFQNLEERDSIISSYSKNKVKKVFDGHFHIGGTSGFGNYFTEYTVVSVVNNYKCAVLTVDQKSGLYNVEQCKFW